MGQKQPLISIFVVWDIWGVNIDKMHTFQNSQTFVRRFKCCARWMNVLGMNTYIYRLCSTARPMTSPPQFLMRFGIEKADEVFKRQKKKTIEITETACRAFYACKDESAHQSIIIVRIKTHINTVGVDWMQKIKDLRHMIRATSSFHCLLSSFVFFFVRSQW